jgi:pyruvate dehydrogenase E2 component (dihydrolipoamide acetyltransferase)
MKINQCQQNYRVTDNKQKNKINVLASPKDRKFARELGVNVNDVTGSERMGRVIEKDIKEFVSSRILKSIDENNKKEEIKIKKKFEHSEFGEIEVKDIPRIKKIAAPHLVNSWSNIPHVTNHDEADITEMEEFRNSLTDIYSGEKKKITPLAFIIKAVVSSLKKFPNFNSSIDDIENGKIILKKYYHIGIAVDTPNGLMVPKIRNVNNKNLNQISKELKKISEDCRNLKINKKEFFGGSITITSLGGIGGSFFTPIINHPEVAILGIGRSYKKQLFINGKFIPRTILPLSLSYDHRIIDGAEAARFNNDLKDNLGSNFAYKLAI